MKLATCIAAASLLVAAQVAVAADAQREEEKDDAPSAMAMMFDLVLVRPVSLVTCVLGTGVFILDLPLMIFQKNAPAEPARRFIVDPLKYTFTRPLGDMS